MRLLMALLCGILFSSFTPWQTDFAKARMAAAQDHKYILLSFSGSDWCGPCIKLHHDYFENNSFTSYAAGHLVLVNADFPRQKKNQLARPLQEQNEKLADLYDTNGSFPLTLLLNAEGKVLKTWDGIPKLSVDEFITAIKTSIDAGK